MAHLPEGTDLDSGFCSSNGIYYSKRPLVWIPEHLYLDLVTFVFAPKFANKVALVDAPTGKSLTYDELEKRFRALAAGLYNNVGVRQDDVVMIIMRNSIEFVVFFFAVLSLGGVVTTMNPLNTAREIRRQIRDSGTMVIFTTLGLVEKVAGLELPIVISDDEKSLSGFDREMIYHYSDLLKTDPHSLPRVEIKHSDTAVLLYSSGTTGKSKGVVLTHRNMISTPCLVQARYRCIESTLSGNVNFSPEDIYLIVVPMFHIFGLSACIVSVLSRGAKLVILPEFSFVKMLAAVQTYKVTHLPLAPPVLIALSKLDVVNKFDISSLVQIQCGAAPVGQEVLDKCKKQFPFVCFIQALGMTEVGGVTPPPMNVRRHVQPSASCGLLLPNTEAIVVDPITNKPQPPTKWGELWIRGPGIMKEYLNNPTATAETIDQDGWLHTGDLVYFDNYGYLYVVDRLKELIKYKGYQVAPAELEGVLLSHTSILDCAVIPYPDEESGQIPMAYVVQKPDHRISSDDVLKWVAKQVAPYKKVRKVAFIDSIPKSAAGKILRKELHHLATAKPKL